MNFKIFLLKVLILPMFIMLFFIPSLTNAYDVNEKLTIEGTLTGIYQYGDIDAEGKDDADRGAAVLDLGINFHPTEKDEFQITLSYAAGNGLNYLEPFSLLPYADDLENDLKDINGRNRDYLLEAWYKHTFTLSKDVSLGLTGGIIDATKYIDDNKFANCECSQFMNEVFVNHTNVNLPSYDIGGIVELNIFNLSIKGLMMNTKFEIKDDVFRGYNYYALQLGYTINTPLGEGNYRVYGFTTNDRFPCWDERGKGSLYGYGISADQELTQIIGAFARFSWQNDKAVITHDEVFSGGINISGKLWGRETDEIGLGVAYLDGADCSNIDNTNAFETYAKFKISDFSDITFDIQYVNDNMKHEKDKDGFVYGIRVNAYF